MCQNIRTEIYGPLTNEQANVINQINSDDIQLITDILIGVETVAFSFVNRNNAVALTTSVGIGVSLNRINGVVASTTRVNVQFGYYIIHTSAVSIYDGLNVHAPATVTVGTVWRT
ncbi:MAG: hypothetical protein MI864_11855, partial [Pseudomonadales bacterium]|nr:hypothetical protein [Pseudomonadales bacterium]